METRFLKWRSHCRRATPPRLTEDFVPADRERALEALMETTTQSVKLGDIEAFVARVGAGKPLVVCGGPQLGHRYMRRLDVLADEHELIYYDARGSGQTELGEASELTFARAVADLERLRAGLGIERFSILGHSLGGHVAYLYASRYPERVEALLLVDVGPPFAQDQATELSQSMTSSRTPEDDARLEEIQGSDAFGRREPKAVEDFILNIYAPFFRDRRSIETFDLGFTAITAANVLDYEERLVASLADEDPVARLAMVRCPTLVVHGELDPIPVAFGRLLADSIPGAEFALLPGAKHFPFLENQDQFQRTVRTFLSTRSTV
ncbi:MAG: alpha/beta fold hydrolase [Gaiellales bacterium]